MPSNKPMGMPGLAGWLGIGLVVSAYALTTFGVLAPASLWYGGLNLVGSAGIIASSYAKRDFQPVVLNTIWIVIAAIGISRAVL